MKHQQRDSWRPSGIFGLSKASSHDCCLGTGDASLLRGHTRTPDQCYYESRDGHNRRRATIVSMSPGSLALEISKSDRARSGNRFLSFLHKGFHARRSKSSSKFDKDKCHCNAADSISDHYTVGSVTPLPIRDTEIQGHTRTLFYKGPDSSNTSRPLLILTEATKIVTIHPSISPSEYSHCVKIISTMSNVYGEESTLYGANHGRVLDDTDNQGKCHSCYSSQGSLFCIEKPAYKPTIGHMFSSNSDVELRRWINKLQRVARPNQQNERRKEVSLDLCILEAKNLPPKKRYFCEVFLDGELYARTRVKVMGDMLFWGEEFNVCNIDELSAMTLIIYKYSEDGRNKKKKSQRKEICKMHIPMKEINNRTIVEKWYSSSSSHYAVWPETGSSHINQGIITTANTAVVPLSQSVPMTNFLNLSTTTISNDQSPMIRIKARYQEIDVLPLSAYSDFTRFLTDNAVNTLVEIEPHLKVKTKEDLIKNLIKIIHKKGNSVPFLCELIIAEINKSEDKNLILRGNTIASKAIETYLKLVGEKYLHLILSDFISRVLLEDEDCEVDPQKEPIDIHAGVSLASLDRHVIQCTLEQRQESLMMNVEMIWAKIMSSTIYFPRDLKDVFVTLRHRLRGSKQCQLSRDEGHEPDLCDRIVSSCVFLRYICPAILTPSLFGLITDYPDNPKVIRTFTLVAKCIQTLANFSNLSGTKETYMVFMNSFIENNFRTMKDFLQEISCEPEIEDAKQYSKMTAQPLSSSTSKDHLYLDSLVGNTSDDTIDLALCLANLHRQMEDCLDVITRPNFSGNLHNLCLIVDEINSKLGHHNDAIGSITLTCSDSCQNMAMAQPLGYMRRHSTQTGSRSSSGDSQDHISDFGMYRPESRRNSNTSGRYSAMKNNRLGSKGSSEASEVGGRRSSSGAVEEKVTFSYTKTGSRRSSCDTVEQVPEVRQYESRRYSCGATEKKVMLGKIKLGSRIVASDALKHGGVPGTARRYSGDECKDKFTLEGRRHSNDNKPEILLFESTRFPSKDSAQLLEASCLRFYDHGDGDVGVVSKNVSTQTGHCLNKSPKSRSTNQVAQEDPMMTSSKVGLVGCQSSDSIDRMRDSLLLAPRSPQSSWKPSVKWCKQSQRVPDVVGKPQSTNHPLSSKELNSTHTLTNKNQSISSSKSAFPVPNNMDLTMQANDARRGDQSHNMDIAQTVLNDRKTLELELKRVRYMKMICDQSSMCEGMSVHNMLQSRDEEIVLSVGDVKTLSVSRYLNVAENVLTDAINCHIDSESGRSCTEAHEVEGRLFQIFQMNRALQSKLMSRSDCPSILPRDHGTRTSHCGDQSSHDTPLDSSQCTYPCPTVIEFIDPL